MPHIQMSIDYRSLVNQIGSDREFIELFNEIGNAAEEWGDFETIGDNLSIDGEEDNLEENGKCFLVALAKWTMEKFPDAFAVTKPAASVYRCGDAGCMCAPGTSCDPAPAAMPGPWTVAPAELPPKIGDHIHIDSITDAINAIPTFEPSEGGDMQQSDRATASWVDVEDAIKAVKNIK